MERNNWINKKNVSLSVYVTYIFLIFLLFNGNILISQNTDSLITVANKVKIDSNKVSALNKLANYFADKYNFVEATNYAKQAKKISDSLHLKKELYEAVLTLGHIEYYQSNFKHAQTYYLQSLKIAEVLKDYKMLANIFSDFAFLNTDLKNYSEAIKNYNLSLDNSLKLNNKALILRCYIGLGDIFDATEQHDKALVYYERALALAKEINNKQSLGVVYVSIGTLYRFSEPKTALNYFTKGASVNLELGNTDNVAITYLNMTEVYTTLKQYQLANNYLEKAYKLSIQTGNKEIIQEGYRLQYLLDSIQGNYKQAFVNYKNYKSYGDSIHNADIAKQTMQEQMQYNFDKEKAISKAEQEKKDAIALQEKSRQQLITLLIAIAGLGVLVIAFLIYRNLQFNKKQNKIIEQQKVEVEEKNKLIEHKHKEITDSITYAERIQRSFMATDEFLQENLKDYFVFFKPKDVVSGDFYWGACNLRESQGEVANKIFYLCTADSTGHGVPGAIMSLLNITSIERAIEHRHNPADILNDARKTIINRLKNDGSVDGGKDGMDCSLLCFDFVNMKLEIAAANNPVWIIRSLSGVKVKELIEIKPDKMPVGKHDKDSISFSQRIVDLESGDIVYTLTDGFPDQFGGNRGRKFMSKNLRELLLANAHLPMQKQKIVLENTFKDWVGNLEQVDDITIIGIRV